MSTATAPLHYVHEDRVQQSLVNNTNQCPNSEVEWGGHSQSWGLGRNCDWCDAIFGYDDLSRAAVRATTRPKPLAELKADFLAAELVLGSAYEALRAGALEAFAFKVGDTLRNADGRTVRVTKIHLDLRKWPGGEFEVHLTPIAYPVKKDGTVGKVGEARIYPDDTWERINSIA